MRKSRFTDEQIVAILRESDRTSVAEAAKRNKVSEQTIYVWRKHFAGLAPADVKRLKALELENAKLKRLLAERELEVELMREVNRLAFMVRSLGKRTLLPSRTKLGCQVDASSSARIGTPRLHACTPCTTQSSSAKWTWVLYTPSSARATMLRSATRSQAARASTMPPTGNSARSVPTGSVT